MTFYVTPYDRMAAMRSAMSHWYQHAIADQSSNDCEMQLAVNVKAVEDAYDITALVPGLSADELEIEVLNDTVTIRGEFKSDEDEDTKYLLSELPDGHFSRVITLPTAADPDKVEASIKNGVLSLHIPMAETDRPKAIKVSVN
jgi:HSP20 family protein